MQTPTPTLQDLAALKDGNAQDLAGGAQDTVARRVVMPKRIWEELTKMAEALEETRDIEVSPLDVAVIALEAGLDEVRRGVTGTSRKATRASKSKSGSQSRGRKKSSSGSQKRKSGSHRRKRPLKLSDEDRAQLEALLLGARSVRARQRQIALWIGHHKRTIHTEWLRQLASEYDAYNVANFAQNMKKDGAYFLERRDAQENRVGWKLTRAGQRHAAVLIENALATA